MTRHNAALSLPLGDRDEVPPNHGGSAAPSSVAERKPEGDLLPGLTLSLDRLGGVLDETRMALGDLNLANAQRDWPLIEAAARRLQSLSTHVAKAVTNARATNRRSVTALTTEGE